MTVEENVLEQLKYLDVLKTSLSSILTSKGVTDLTGDEKLDDLIPMVNNLPTVLDGSTGINSKAKFIDTDSAGISIQDELDYFTNNFDTRNLNSYKGMFLRCTTSAGELLTTLNLSNLNTSNVITMNSMFVRCSNLTTLDFSNFNTSNVTDMNSMFKQCSNLTTLDLSNFNTSNVTDMGNMFKQCSALTTLDLSNFNTSNVTIMTDMFHTCSALTTLDLRGWDTSNVTSMEGLFYYTSRLTTILGLTSFDTSNVTSMRSMFNGDRVKNDITSLDLSSFTASENGVTTYTMFNNCTNLQHLDMRKFDFTRITTFTNMFGSAASRRVPANCEIIVKDNTQKQWIATNFSWLTNVKTVAEYEAEQNN